MQGELDELEREEFFRLKKVQNKKQQKGAPQTQQVRGTSQGRLQLYEATNIVSTSGMMWASVNANLMSNFYQVFNTILPPI